MTSTSTSAQDFEAFGKAYDYDAGYLIQLSETSEGALAAFTAAMGLSKFREELPLDAHFVARIVAMQSEDCGPCAQLNLRLAVEAGVDRELLKTLLECPEELPAELQDVRLHTRAVIEGSPADPERYERLRARWGDAAFSELATCIAGCRLFPTMKRSLLSSAVCQTLSLDF